MAEDGRLTKDITYDYETPVSEYEVIYHGDGYTEMNRRNRELSSENRPGIDIAREAGDKGGDAEGKFEEQGAKDEAVAHDSAWLKKLRETSEVSP